MLCHSAFFKFVSPYLCLYLPGSGNLIELEDDSPNLPDPVPSINGTMEDNSTESGSGSGSGSEIIPYEVRSKPQCLQ